MFAQCTQRVVECVQIAQFALKCFCSLNAGDMHEEWMPTCGCKLNSACLLSVFLGYYPRSIVIAHTPDDMLLFRPPSDDPCCCVKQDMVRSTLLPLHTARCTQGDLSKSSGNCLAIMVQSAKLELNVSWSGSDRTTCSCLKRPNVTFYLGRGGGNRHA